MGQAVAQFEFVKLTAVTIAATAKINQTRETVHSVQCYKRMNCCWYRQTFAHHAAHMRGCSCTAFLQPLDRLAAVSAPITRAQRQRHLLHRPRSPSTTPRHTEQQQQLELVRDLRVFLLQAAQQPDWSIELEDLLLEKLRPLSKHALDPIRKTQQAGEGLTAEQLVELESGECQARWAGSRAMLLHHWTACLRVCIVLRASCIDGWAWHAGNQATRSATRTVTGLQCMACTWVDTVYAANSW